MEENLPARQENLLPTLTHSKGLILTSQTNFGDAHNSEIIAAIKYIMVLLGTPKERMPASIEMMVIINYLRVYMAGTMVDELKIAFDLAVQKKYAVNLDLYGSTLSVNYLLNVLNPYFEYKKKLLKKIESKPEPMTNTDRGMKMFEIIRERDPELWTKLRNLGKDEKPKVELPPLPFHDIHQKWMRQFDKLRMKYEVANGFISRYGYIMNIEGYFNKKAEQLQMAKERNNDVL